MNNIEIEVMESIVLIQDLEVQKVLDEYRDIFREELSDGLSSQCAIDHEINTENEAPSNRNAYPLSIVQLQK